jgi:hypothetical protein
MIEQARRTYQPPDADPAEPLRRKEAEVVAEMDRYLELASGLQDQTRHRRWRRLTSCSRFDVAYSRISAVARPSLQPHERWHGSPMVRLSAYFEKLDDRYVIAGESG